MYKELIENTEDLLLYNILKSLDENNEEYLYILNSINLVYYLKESISFVYNSKNKELFNNEIGKKIQKRLRKRAVDIVLDSHDQVCDLPTSFDKLPIINIIKKNEINKRDQISLVLTDLLRYEPNINEEQIKIYKTFIAKKAPKTYSVFSFSKDYNMNFNELHSIIDSSNKIHKLDRLDKIKSISKEYLSNCMIYAKKLEVASNEEFLNLIKTNCSNVSLSILLELLKLQKKDARALIIEKKIINNIINKNINYHLFITLFDKTLNHKITNKNFNIAKKYFSYLFSKANQEKNLSEYNYETTFKNLQSFSKSLNNCSDFEYKALLTSYTYYHNGNSINIKEEHYKIAEQAIKEEDLILCKKAIAEYAIKFAIEEYNISKKKLIK